MDRYMLVETVGKKAANVIAYDTYANIQVIREKFKAKNKHDNDNAPMEYSLEIAYDISGVEEIIVTYQEGSKTYFKIYKDDDIYEVKDYIIEGKLDRILAPKCTLLSVALNFDPLDREHTRFIIYNKPTIIRDNRYYFKTEVVELCRKAYEEAFHLAQTKSPVKDIDLWLKNNNLL